MGSENAYTRILPLVHRDVPYICALCIDTCLLYFLRDNDDFIISVILLWRPGFELDGISSGS